MSETIPLRKVGDRVRINKSPLLSEKLSGQHGIVTAVRHAGPMIRQKCTVLLDSDGLEHDVDAAFLFPEHNRGKA